MRMSGIIFTLAMLAVGGCATMQNTTPETLKQTARQELASVRSDSDEAIILSRALDDASKTGPRESESILQNAIRRAAEARDFRIVEESPCRRIGPGRRSRAWYA